MAKYAFLPMNNKKKRRIVAHFEFSQNLLIEAKKQINNRISQINFFEHIQEKFLHDVGSSQLHLDREDCFLLSRKVSWKFHFSFNPQLDTHVRFKVLSVFNSCRLKVLVSLMQNGKNVGFGLLGLELVQRGSNPLDENIAKVIPYAWLIHFTPRKRSNSRLRDETPALNVLSK